MLNKMLIAAVLGVFFITVFDVALFADEYVYDFGRLGILDKTPMTLKEQIAKGVPYNQVVCYDEMAYYVIYRVSDGSPVCVKDRTAPKLVERGWATLGNSSLSIITDKREYEIGEPITITMKNDGDTLLMYHGCSPNFVIYDENDDHIHPYGTIALPPCNTIRPFDNLSSITLVWSQYDFFGNQTNPGIHTVVGEHLFPFVNENKIHYNEVQHNTTFTILP